MEETKEIAKKEQGLASNKSLGIKGFIGYDMGDLPIPYLRLIQVNTKNENKFTNEGKEAKPGQIMHSLTGETKDSWEVVVLGSKNDTQERQDLNTGEYFTQTVDKIIAIPVGGTQPVMIYASVVNSGAWRKYMGNLAYRSIAEPYKIITKLSSEEYTNKKQQTWRVFNFELGKETSKGDLETAEQLLSNMGESVFDINTGEDVTVEEVKGNTVVTGQDTE